jgi:hypothetical protein
LAILCALCETLCVLCGKNELFNSKGRKEKTKDAKGAKKKLFYLSIQDFTLDSHSYTHFTAKIKDLPILRNGKSFINF